MSGLSIGVICGALVAVAGTPTTTSQEFGRAVFSARGDLQPYRSLSPDEKAAFELGQQVFNSHFVPTGTPGAGRLAGLGPLHNAPSCDACHNDGARGRGPAGDGEVPVSLVMQLGHVLPAGGEIQPDLAYGRTLNTNGANGVKPEGRVFVHYQEMTGHFPDGSEWHLRVPHYELRDLAYGPVAETTVLMPRIAPAIYGAGLLEAAQLAPESRSRFGWQGASVSVRDQTTKAFAREMGVTSADVPSDDCTALELDCRSLPNAGPEISDDLLIALASFERLLAVPSVAREDDVRDGKIFVAIGCAGCHTPSLPVSFSKQGSGSESYIHAYTDLRLHDLGVGLADRTFAGRIVSSRWRTAPLWGVGYRPRPNLPLTFLHDGRARSIVEAVLWHDGEGRTARRKFETLGAADREALERWILGL